MSKLVATGLEQLSRMCWAANWALTEKEQAQASAVLFRQGRPRVPVDVRLNFVVGDAVDTCDALCLLSSEGLSAWGKARDGDEVRGWGGGGELCVVFAAGPRRGEAGETTILAGKVLCRF